MIGVRRNKMKKITKTFHLVSLVLTFILKLRFSADTSIADVIRKRYGTSTLTTYRTWERKKRKYEKAVLDVEFLESCPDNYLIPKLFNFTLYKRKLKEGEAYKDFQRKLLLMEITARKKDMNELKVTIQKLNAQMKNSVHYIDFIHLNSLSDRFAVKDTQRVKAIHIKKLNKLVRV